jgi:FkbM family methyltransferase
MNSDHAVLKTLKKIGKWLWFCRNYLLILNFPIPCRLPCGSWFLIHPDEIGLTIFLRKPFEENERRFVAKFLKPGMTFFDIGANQGFYTLLAASRIGLRSKVFAFEPVPGEFRKLKWNVRINRLRNITMERLGLGCREGTTDMFVCLDGKGSYSSLRPPVESIRTRKKLIQVPVIDLDSYVHRNNIQHIDFIKIDVEGGELDVLKGGLMVLRKLRPIVMCEIADIRTQQWGYNASNIYKFLEKYGYLWFQIASDGKLLPSKVKERYDPNWENLIAVPREKLTEISTFRKDT